MKVYSLSPWQRINFYTDTAVAKDWMSETKQHPQPGSQSTRRIDRRKAAVRYRYTCPQGHVNWDRTNNHIWCPSCRRQNEHGNDVDPEHWLIIDQKTGEQIAWKNVELVEDGS